MAQRVLLIEDEANIAEALSFIFQRAGYALTHLRHGNQAVAEAVACGADVIVLDYMLPGLSGIEILHLLRADPRTSAVPVLMLTAKGQPRDREAAERAGASAFMTKPFAIADILAEVSDLLPAIGPKEASPQERGGAQGRAGGAFAAMAPLTAPRG